MKKDNIRKLYTYLASSEGWVTASELASYLHTTPRTISNYVQRINADSACGNLILSSSKGYRWQPAELNDALPYTLEHVQPVTPDDRITYILRNLLYRNTVHISPLLSALSISQRTLETDMIRIKGILEPYRLRLHMRQESFYLSGNECDRRRLIVTCILRTGQAEFLTLEYIKKCFPDMDVTHIHSLLCTTLGSFSLTADSYHLYFLLLYVVLQLTQIKKNSVVDHDEFDFPSGMKDCRDWEAAVSFTSALSENYHFSPEEKLYLTSLFLSFAMPSIPNYPVSAHLWDNWNPIAWNCLKIAEQYLSIDCSQDHFPDSLTHFFIRMQIRQKMHLGIPHLLTPSVRQIHPLLLDISANMLLYTDSRMPLDAPDQETGFLALFLADFIYTKYPFESKVSCTLISPFGQNLTKKLADDLDHRLGNSLYINHIVTTIDVDHLPADSDLTISLIPLEYLPHTVIISPLPKSEDYRLVRHEIQRIKRERDRILLQAYFTAYLLPEYFQVNQHFSSQKEVIHSICRHLKERNAVDETFEKALLQREAMDSTAFNNMIALPHACLSGVKKNTLCIVSNQEALPWGNSQVNIIILIAIQEDLLIDFINVYGLLVKIFSNSKNALALKKADTYDHLLEALQAVE